MSGPIGIEGREYKLLLDPLRFAGAAPEKVAKRLWNKGLRPIIEQRLGPKDDGEARAEGELRLKKQRLVVFFDTKERHLARHGLALRKRTFVENGVTSGVPEVTLKFRTPDLLLAAEYCRQARRCAGDTKLEEDIAPLQVSRGERPAVVAKPASTYSRFSVSTSLELDAAFDTLADVLASFPMVEERVDREGGLGAETLRLRSGAVIREWVFQSATVDLGRALDAEFGFTLWHFAKSGPKRDAWKRAATVGLDPDIAEISFDFETRKGRMESAAAERASALFIAMQEALPINTSETSKTALALPA